MPKHKFHGEARHEASPESAEYSMWCAIKARCFNPKNKAFRYYGGRGITMCEEWRNDFPAFLAYVGRRPNGMTLDRIDNNRNYEPGNVRWAALMDQLSNRSNTHLIEYNGEKMMVSQWAKKLGMNHRTLKARIQRGWSIESAFTRPVPCSR